jgi:adenosylmethionine-8-amino-7-oxononanoate aminotransferase
VCLAAREEGAILRSLGDAIIFMPPLAMTCGQINGLVQAVGRALLGKASQTQCA